MLARHRAPGDVTKLTFDRAVAAVLTNPEALAGARLQQPCTVKEMPPNDSDDRSRVYETKSDVAVTISSEHLLDAAFVA